MSIDDAVIMLRNAHLDAIISRNNILGGTDMEQDEGIVSFRDRFIIEQKQTTWFSMFPIGQTVVIVKVSQDVMVAAKAVVDLFEMARLANIAINTMLYELARLHSHALPAEVVESMQIKVLAPVAGLKQANSYDLMLNLGDLTKSEKAIMLRLHDEQWSIDRNEENESTHLTTVPTIEDATNYILDSFAV